MPFIPPLTASTPSENVNVIATPAETPKSPPSGTHLEIRPWFYAFIAVLFLKALGVPPEISAWFYALTAIASLAVMGIGPKVYSLMKKKNREKFF